MSPPASVTSGPAVAFGVALLLALVLGGGAVASAKSDALMAILGVSSASPGHRIGAGRSLLSSRWRHPAWRAAILGVLFGAFGLQLAGVGGFLAGAGVGAASPFMLDARRQRRRADELERCVAEVAESAAMGVRSGLSIPQALRFAADEVGDPVGGSIDELLRAIALGTPLDRAITTWAEETNTNEAMLLALIVSIHARSGGDLAGALEEVSRTIRHRISVRRELRAMSAQGRISGAILGSLPIGFFLVLAATSRSELDPVYRSTAGATMVAIGLVLEVLAYVWIRRLLHVEV
jgi:tight adherence protein B